MKANKWKRVNIDSGKDDSGKVEVQIVEYIEITSDTEIFLPVGKKNGRVETVRYVMGWPMPY